MLTYGICLSELDQGFLTGFLEGEACFVIGEQNGGQSYSCGVFVSVRDDDQDLLEWLVALTGLGRLRRMPAQPTSRPQINWRIDTQHECGELLRLIERCGFHGRRAAELDIWAQAVAAWTQEAGTERISTLRSLKRRLDTARRYRDGAMAARPFSARDRLTLGYISGLVCAEGSCYFGAHRPRFSMHMRQDDRLLLDLVCSTTGLGALYDHVPPAPANPSTAWTICARDELERFAELMYEAGLPGRKGIELETWAVAVHEWCSAKRLGVRPRKYLMQLAADQLRALRRYRPSTRELLQLSRRDIRAESLAALKAWSDEVDEPLGCGAYMRWRRAHPEMPTRNTVAKAFGGWRAALEAAGLAHRAARRPTRAGGEEARRARREAQRSRVIAAVARFEAEHGRPPRAMEFFKWRRAAVPDSPTQASVYKLFPGGWDAVLAACRG